MQIEFDNAFCQDPLKENMYMHIPRGFKLINGQQKTDYCYVFHKSIYGIKTSARSWFDILSSGTRN